MRLDEKEGEKVCDRCGGSGYVPPIELGGWTRICPTCHGKRVVPIEEKKPPRGKI